MMMPAGRHHRLLGPEALESRMLLAGTADPYGLVADFNLAMEAVSATGDFEAAFSANFGNRQLVISGGAEGALMIDMNILPDFISNLRIDSFANVTFTGSDTIVTLVLEDIENFSAPGLAVTNVLDSNEVSRINLDSIGMMALLDGTETHLSARVLDGVTVISDLQSLTLDSESANLTFISVNSDQRLQLENVPVSIALTGISEKSVEIASPGGEDSTDSGDNGSLPDDVIVIEQPDDERTRAFIAELRELLHRDTMGSDPDGALLDIQAYANLLSGNFGSTVVVNGIAVARDTIPSELMEAARILVPQSADADLMVGTGESILPTYATIPGGEHVPGAGDADIPELTQGIFPASTVEFDATWPVALPQQHFEDLPAQAVSGSEDTGPSGTELKTSILAFGDYLMERVSSEFSPGGQSMVLIVDPRPSRPAQPQTTSALDLFSRANRTTLSSLERAMR